MDDWITIRHKSLECRAICFGYEVDGRTPFLVRSQDATRMVQSGWFEIVRDVPEITNQDRDVVDGVVDAKKLLKRR